MRETFPRTKTYTIESLRQKVQNRFEQAGLSEYQAREMSEQLLYAEMRGISSHGLVRIKWVTEQLHKYPLRMSVCFYKTGRPNCTMLMVYLVI
ncbi:Ldh family oxidoreductase [Paenibacillus larvae]|nr:Ldh family oxidoreductase [Paenibacillus larvae]MDT2241693.1 Ldh family oxidoreductase [Paenibacillus larvae]MDT2305483.1 Ldh family oxidoreductase [Paenibacillus larvae]